MEWYRTNGPVPSGIPFAIDAKGVWRDISDVESGLKCGCFCSACKGRLVAKKGIQNTHHFAHHDRKDCRHALESSLYGMLVDILTKPNSGILLPPHIERVLWLRETGIPEGSKPYLEFAQKGWVFEPATVIAQTGFQCMAQSLELCSANVPEFEDSASRVEIHVLSYRKKFDDLRALAPREGWIRLGLNLRFYADLWWATCDLSHGANLIKATKARDRLASWLAAEPSGRGILMHPEEHAKKAQFTAWANQVAAAEIAKVRAEREAQAKLRAEREREERRWVIPQATGITGSHRVWQPSKTNAVPGITDTLAMQMGLQKSPTGQGMAFIGIPGQRVPTHLRSYLSPDGPWHFMPKAAESNHPKHAPLTPPTEDKLLEKAVATCYCGAPIDRVLHGGGMFQGRIVEQCTAYPGRHPLKIVGRAT